MRRQRARREQRAARDAGVTLVELLVAMSVFGILLAVIASTVVDLTRVTVRAQDVADSADDLRTAFLQMDRQVRYADAVNYPGPGGTAATAADWYVELRTTSLTSDAPLCVQWRTDFANGMLQTRTWPDGATPGADWQTVARHLRSDPNPKVRPFAMLSAGHAYPSTELTALGVDPTSAVRAAADDQRLVVALRGGTHTGSTAAVTTTFVARNSSPDSPGNAALPDTTGLPVSSHPVCGSPSSVRS